MTYGYPLSYIAVRDGEDFAAIPIMTVPNIVFSAKGVCLPFSDSCGPVFTSRRALNELMTYVLKLAQARNWRKFELRADCAVPELKGYDRYFEHVLQLSSDVEQIFASFRSSTRRNIEKALREGVEAKISNSADSMEAYYWLHCRTRKRLGVPPQPKSFFCNIYKHVVQPGNGFIVKACYRGKTIAAAVFLHFGETSVYKFGASLPDSAHLRPNNLVLWKGIRWYASHGFKELSLGRTDSEDFGLMQFKNGWGGRCREIVYSRWQAQECFQRKFHTSHFQVLSSIMKVLPLPILKMLGTVAYRFFG
jgi:hypothetical protein